MSKMKSIAITGKGGTGKTMVATMMIKELKKSFKGKLLVIDADSAMSLPYTLNIPVTKKTVSQLRADITGPGMVKDQGIDVWMESVVMHADGLDMVVMGRPEAPGCFCSVNDLLKYAIGNLSEKYDLVIIDGEAGPEQLNRRVMSSIDMLLVVSDMSARSLETACGIMDVAKRGEDDIRIGKSCLVLNRVKEDNPKDELLEKANVEVIARFPEDPVLNKFDREGRSLLELPDESGCVLEARRLVEEILA